MPGFVALIVVMLIAIAAVVVFLTIYFAAGRLKMVARYKFPVAVAAAIGFAGFLWWGWASFHESTLTQDDLAETLAPALQNGASFQDAYFFDQDLSSGTYVRLRMSERDFPRFLEQARHEPDDDGPYVIEAGNGVIWGPEWARDVDCPDLLSFRPDFTIPSERPIDDYDIDYCAESETLYLIKIRI